MKIRTTRIIAKHAPGISPKEARDCRALAWQFVFACHAKKKAARPGGPDDAEELRNDRTDTSNYTGV
jgi:hypothetical protein